MKLKFTPNGIWFLYDNGKPICFMAKNQWDRIDEPCRVDIAAAVQVEEKLQEVGK